MDSITPETAFCRADPAEKVAVHYCQGLTYPVPEDPGTAPNRGSAVTKLSSVLYFSIFGIYAWSFLTGKPLARSVPVFSLGVSAYPFYFSSLTWDLKVPRLGLTSVRLAIHSVDDPSASTEVDLLVDTDSILTWIPQKLLAKLEIKPRRRGRFKTIQEEIIERDVGIAGVKYSGQEAIVKVVFATDGDAQALGVTTLESLCLQRT